MRVYSSRVGFTFILAAALLVGVALIDPIAAHAARAGAIDVDEAELYESPGKQHKILEKLPRGTKIATSNQPVEGFYKVRTPSGIVGFVASEAIAFLATPSEEFAPPQSTPANDPGTPKESLGVDKTLRKRPPLQRIRLNLYGGYNFFNVGEVNELLQATVLRFGYNYGGELGFLFTPDIAMVVRFERVFKSVFARDTSTYRMFDFSVSSYPSMVGIELTLTSDQRISTHFSILGGLALQTALSATDQNSAAPNVTTLSAHAFTGLAKADIVLHFNKTWSIFTEVGYRYLKTIQVQPPDSESTASGSSVFKDPTTQKFIPVSLDLSGPVIAIGAGVTF